MAPTGNAAIRVTYRYVASDTLDRFIPSSACLRFDIR